jgi:hypothetical protein
MSKEIITTQNQLSQIRSQRITGTLNNSEKTVLQVKGKGKVIKNVFPNTAKHVFKLISAIGGYNTREPPRYERYEAPNGFCDTFIRSLNGRRSKKRF